MKHKVSELTGVLLDAAVAHAHGWQYRIEHGVCDVMVMAPSFSAPPVALGQKGGEFAAWKLYYPSNRWSQAGPIIERENLCLEPWKRGTPEWASWVADDEEVVLYGATPLIAAMRAFVAAKLGDEVELPT